MIITHVESKPKEKPAYNFYIVGKEGVYDARRNRFISDAESVERYCKIADSNPASKYDIRTKAVEDDALAKEIDQFASCTRSSEILLDVLRRQRDCHTEGLLERLERVIPKKPQIRVHHIPV
jgi:hypothetical protein